MERIALMIVLIFTSLISKGQLILLDEKKEATERIIFVHGYGGDENTTWQNPDSKFLFHKELSQDPEMKNFEIFSFKYPSTCSKTAPIMDVAKVLFKELNFIKKKYKRTHFVAHSLGGIIVRQLLTSNEYKLSDGEIIQLLGTPNLGVEASSITQIPCLSISEMNNLSSDQGSQIDQLNDRWREKFEQADSKKTTYFAAFEQPIIFNLKIVKKSSALLFSQKTTFINANHMGIAKPIDKNDFIYKWVKENFLKPPSTAAKEMSKTRFVSRLEKNSIHNYLVVSGVENDKEKVELFKLIDSRRFVSAAKLIENKKNDNAGRKQLFLAYIDEAKGNYNKAIPKYVDLIETYPGIYKQDLFLGSIFRYYDQNEFENGKIIDTNQFGNLPSTYQEIIRNIKMGGD